MPWRRWRRSSAPGRSRAISPTQRPPTRCSRRPARSTSSSPTPRCPRAGSSSRSASSSSIARSTVNLRAPMLLARRLAPRDGDPRRAATSSSCRRCQGRWAAPGTSVYAATKFGLRGFALVLREDLRAAGVGVSVVLPGFVRDAGMYADAGVRLPPWRGHREPRASGRAKPPTPSSATAPRSTSRPSRSASGRPRPASPRRRPPPCSGISAPTGSRGRSRGASSPSGSGCRDVAHVLRSRRVGRRLGTGVAQPHCRRAPPRRGGRAPARDRRPPAGGRARPAPGARCLGAARARSLGSDSGGRGAPDRALRGAAGSTVDEL